VKKTVARYGRVDPLCIDELSYMELGRRGAELLFQVLTEREEKNSVAIASNESFGSWTKAFTDPRLCAAIVDRLTFGGNIIQTGTDSYRLANTRAHTGRGPSTGHHHGTGEAQQRPCLPTSAAVRKDCSSSGAAHHSASALRTSSSRPSLMPADASPKARTWVLKPSLRWNSAPCRPSVTATISSRRSRCGPAD
jgi:hypothetical protein